MNTIRIARNPVQLRREPEGMRLRGPLVAAFLSCAVFAGCFAIGRAERPGSTPREQGPPGIPAASAGTAIPVRLSDAPPLGIVIPPVVKTRARTPSPSVAAPTPAAEAEPSVAPSAPAAASEPATPVAPATPAAPVAPSSTPAQPSGGSTPAAKGGSGSAGSAPSSETSGSTSFDSSG